ncbi:MAG: alpha/beta fold hydrolase [Leptospiraceae bacterium]|nr:alpha/beta fold hydrolase [Leptospiraceae bacterium]
MSEKKTSNKKLFIKLFIIDSILLILFAGGWFFSTTLMYPPPFTCQVDHFVNCGDPKSDFGIDFEEVEYKTKDDFKISAWYVPAKNDSGKSVISIHGRGADRREGLRHVKALHELGVNVILPDLRNCGKSDKSFNSMTFHERKDVDATFHFLKIQKKQNSIGILGFSMGGATSILYMAENPEIKVGVFDSPFADFKRIITENAKMMYSLPEFPLLSITVFLYEKRAEVEVEKMSPISVISSISPRPILLFHGTDDKTVPYPHSKDLFEKAGEPKELITVEGGVHVELWQVDERVRNKTVEYFSKYL